jgi:WhiB family transcriptional regulator, redox-sensing transcriptional regulator
VAVEGSVPWTAGCGVLPSVPRGAQEEKALREMRAKTICDQCRVRGDCLEYAIRIREPHGIWGGMNEMERKLMLDRRAS